MSKKQTHTKRAQVADQPEEKDNGFNRVSQGVNGLLKRASSRVRLSLTFRIAVHYCVQLIRSFVPMCLVLALVFSLAQLPGIHAACGRLAKTPPPADGVYTQLELQDHELSARLLGQPYPADGGGQAELIAQYLISGLQSGRLNVVCRAEFAAEDALLVSFRLNDRLTVLMILMGGLLVMDLLRMLYFIRHSHRLDRRVLAPIRDITDMAATLSASNLSNRINIAGTKNELRDLAVVINTMLDRIERSYNSQKQFVSDASHELRTPIAVIQGYVNMLQRWGKDDPEVLGEGLTAISQETASMKDLVENLLFLARHDKKTLMMEMSKFDPCDVLTELHKEAQLVTPGDTFVLDPVQHCTLTADRNMVKQVMRILLDNAVKYTLAGGTITMGAACSDNACTLIMKDNGPGIPAEELPKIFDRFYRSDKARKSESGGHGLGLSIARIIVVAHGGKIRVRSKVGEGTSFYVTLPLEKNKN